ncbi:metallophosphoesterase family protein [Burkholderia vietnamiensis]|uniref:metallophosphoesterase family protein n=1 Tax=Burkholderia vietnamiensis TaxID=60552 RepID=UPI00158DF055|nr:metallophosphoesterase [Burkholderia vietnamiensis]
MKLFHLTDIHCGNPKAPYQANELVDALSKFEGDFSREDTYLVISGDVTLQGQTAGYAEAQDIVQRAWLNRQGAPERIIVCPGNHDICDNGFEAFDAFVYSVRRDNEIRFQNQSACLLSFNEVLFAIVNSAHHRDHRFGAVDISELERKLTAVERLERQRRVAIVHHHVVGVDGNDLSTIRNALPFLETLQDCGFELLLHGHRHSLSKILIGDQGMQIRAGRSLNFSTPGYVNGISIHDSEGGSWQSKDHFLSKDVAGVGRAAFMAQGGA